MHHLIQIIISIGIIGFIGWVILLIPMPDAFRRIIVGLMVVGVVLFLLKDFGLYKLPVLR